MGPFDDLITAEEELRTLAGSPGDRSLQKIRAIVDAHCRTFIAPSPFLLMATSDSRGRCDVSPRGDHPGFVLVLDEHRLVIPERPGTNASTGCGTFLSIRTSASSSSSPGGRRRCV